MPSRQILAVHVEYTLTPHNDAERYEPEQAFYWLARLNEKKPPDHYVVSCLRSAYVDSLDNPLWLVQIKDTRSNKTFYARKLTLVQL